MLFHTIRKLLYGSTYEYILTSTPKVKSMSNVIYLIPLIAHVSFNKSTVILLSSFPVINVLPDVSEFFPHIIAASFLEECPQWIVELITPLSYAAAVVDWQADSEIKSTRQMLACKQRVRANWRRDKTPPKHVGQCKTKQNWEKGELSIY